MTGRNVFIKILALALVIFLCGPLFSVLSFADDYSTIGEDRDKLKEIEAKLNAVKQKQSEAKKNQTSAGNEYDTLFDKKIAIEESISLLEEEIKLTADILAQYDERVKELVTEVMQCRDEISRIYDIYDELVVYYYSCGEANSLELLFSSESISDFLTRRDYISSITDYMSKLAADAEAKEIDLKNAEEEHVTAKTDLENYQKELDEAKIECEEQIAALDALMEDVTGEISLSVKQQEALKKEREELEADIADLMNQISEKRTYIEGDYSWPIAARYWSKCSLISGFDKTAKHYGIDIKAPEGTPVQAVKSGTVLKSEMTSDFGNMVMISHGDGTITIYAHLDKRLVSEGATVTQNQVIGRVGRTGNSSEYHLHFAVIAKDSDGDTAYADPADYLDDYIKDALKIK